MELPTIINRVTYQKDSFCILSANLDIYSPRYKPEMEEMVKDAINKKYDSFTVVIKNLMSPIENVSGGQYIFVGEFVNDPKRGKQFQSEFYYLDIPSSTESLQTFLMILPNIKEARSQAILKKWSIDEIIDILDNNPNRLTEINGITSKRIAAIKKEWDEKRYLCKFYTWLLDNQISIKIADKAYKLWGTKSIDVLSENPYKLCDLRGIGFLTADKMAHKILKEVPPQFRMKACISYILEEQLNSNSNLCVPYSILSKEVLKQLEECDQNLQNKSVSIDEYISILSLCLKSHLKDDFAVIKDIEEKMIYVYIKKIWEKEKYIAEKMFERFNTKHEFHNIDAVIERVIN